MNFKQFFTESWKQLLETKPNYGNVHPDEVYRIDRTKGVLSYTLSVYLMLGDKTLQAFGIGEKIKSNFEEEHWNFDRKDIRWIRLYGYVQLDVKVKKDENGNWQLLEHNYKIIERRYEDQEISVFYDKLGMDTLPIKPFIHANQYPLVSSIVIKDMKRHILETFNKHINDYCNWTENFYVARANDDR